MFTFALCVLSEEEGFFQGLVAGGFAFGAESAQFDHGALDGAADTPFVEREECEVVAFEDPGLGFGDSFAHDDLAGVFVMRAGRMAGAAFEADGEGAGFDSTNTLQAPVVFGDGLGEGGFEVANGSEGFDDAFAMDGEGFLFAVGEELDLAGEAVSIGIEPGAVGA